LPTAESTAACPAAWPGGLRLAGSSACETPRVALVALRFHVAAMVHSKMGASPCGCWHQVSHPALGTGPELECEQNACGGHLFPAWRCYALPSGRSSRAPSWNRAMARDRPRADDCSVCPAIVPAPAVRAVPGFHRPKVKGGTQRLATQALGQFCCATRGATRTRPSSRPQGRQSLAYQPPVRLVSGSETLPRPGEGLGGFEAAAAGVGLAGLMPQPRSPCLQKVTNDQFRFRTVPCYP